MNRGRRPYRSILLGTLSVLVGYVWLQVSLGQTSSISTTVTYSSVEISTNPAHHNELDYAVWTPSTAQDVDNVDRSRNILRRELAKYPEGSLARNGIAHIYLVKNLHWGGLKQSAMPEAFIDHALYLSIDDEYMNAEKGRYYPHLIHHELKHILDAHIYGTYRYQDSAWLACNPWGFAYLGSGLGFNMSHANTRTEHPRPGFVTSYSESAIEEDRAEVHAYQMTKPLILENLASQDASLKCKTDLTTTFLRSL